MADRTGSISELEAEIAWLRTRVIELEADLREKDRLGHQSQMRTYSYRQAVDQSPNAILSVDSTGKIVSWNATCEHILGYSFDEAVNQDFLSSVLEPQFRERVSQVITAVFLGKSYSDLELVLRGRDGAMRHVVSVAYPLQDNNGKVIECVLSNADVTYQARSEKNLEKELAKFRVLYDLAVAMTGERSLDDNLSLVVEKARELLNTDTSFIALQDETMGEIYMHTLSGVRTEVFKGLRLPIGRGLGGKVVKSGRGRVVEDYFQEVEPVVCSIVRTEGLISGIAVPIQIGGTDLGVLYAFNREKTKFTKSDLDTLSLLGNLAAVEITQKRALEQLSEAHEDLENRVDERTWELQTANEKLLNEIAERQRIELALRESENRYRKLVDQANDIIYVTDANGFFTLVNPTGQRISGYSQDELIGKHFLEFLPSHYRKNADRLYRMQVQRGHVDSYAELPIATKQGQIVWIGQNAQLVMDGGTVVGFQAIARDITERKLAEHRLKQSERRFRRLAEAAPFGLSVSSPNGRFEYVNPQFVEIFGYDREDLINQETWFATVFPDTAYREKVLSAWMQDANGSPIASQTQPCTFSVTCKDGIEKTVAFRTVVMDDGRLVVVYEDVTEKIKLEDEIQKVQRLESIGILAGGIAHDFNNILAAILGNISLARTFLPPEHEMAERLSEAEKACARARGLTQQLLTFSKGGAPIKKVAHIASLVEDACLFALRGSNVRCDFSMAPDLSPVEVDTGQISQVIHNLAINAYQAMPTGGVLEVKVENANAESQQIPSLAGGEYIRASVTDYGLGIPKELISKIFYPYFTTKATGSGLGLATSYSIVKNHGGIITVESEPAAGTTFHVYLPASRKAVPDAADPDDSPQPGSGKILIMDDEESIRVLAAECLTMLGYRVETAGDGTEAIELFAKAQALARPFDAVILDLTVPGGMGGREAIVRLRDLDPNVRAIVSSGYSNDPIMAQYAEYGFQGVIPKPYDATRLSEVVRRVLLDRLPEDLCEKKDATGRGA